jgi:hypothetical protein
MIHSPPWKTTSYSSDQQIPRPFYGSQRFISLFTRVRNWTLLHWVRRIRSTFSRTISLSSITLPSTHASLKQSSFIVWRLHNFCISRLNHGPILLSCFLGLQFFLNLFVSLYQSIIFWNLIPFFSVKFPSGSGRTCTQTRRTNYT